MERMSAKEYRDKFINNVDEDINELFKPVQKKKKKKQQTKLEPLEHDIQSLILERLKHLKKAFFWRENSGAFALEHQGKKRFFRAGTPGIADIMGVWNGVPVAIEVKRPKTKNNVSVDQLAFLQRFRECGGIAIVCFDDAKVVQQIEEAVSKNLK